MADLGRHALIAGFDRPAVWSYRLSDGKMERVQFRPDNVASGSAALEPMLVGGPGIGRLPDVLARASVMRGIWSACSPTRKAT